MTPPLLNGQNSERCAPRVLVADGDPVTRTHLQEILRKTGYDVVVAEDGVQALELLQGNNPPGVVILDWSMPKLPGPDICHAIRAFKQRRHIYVILMAQWNQEKTWVQAREEGADDCMCKPVDFRELQLRLQTGSRIVLERAYRDSEARLRDAFEQAAIAMALVDLTGKFMQVNSAMCRFVGYTVDELLGMRVDSLSHPENQPSTSQLVSQLGSGELKSGEFERRYLRKDGSVAWALNTISLVRDENGIPAYTTAQLIDITERKEAEKALQRSEGLFRAIVDNTSDLIMVRDLQYRCQYASPAYLSFLGYSAAELLGTGPSLIVHPDDLHMTRQVLAAMRQDGQNRVTKYRYRHRNGTTVHLEANIGLVGGPDRAEGFVIIFPWDRRTPPRRT
jgi:PAS domain S-box-containing protein